MVCEELEEQVVDYTRPMTCQSACLVSIIEDRGAKPGERGAKSTVGCTGFTQTDWWTRPYHDLASLVDCPVLVICSQPEFSLALGKQIIGPVGNDA